MQLRRCRLVLLSILLNLFEKSSQRTISIPSFHPSMAKGEAVEDGISKLPEPIMQHILSFLTTKEGAQASLLSKAWLSAWRTRPCLCLEDPLLDSPVKSYLAEGSIVDRRGDMFSSFVNKLMLNYRDSKLGMSQLKLKMIFKNDLIPLVDEWIRIASEKEVKMLELSFRQLNFLFQGHRLLYAIPRLILEFKYLEGLSLTWCMFDEQQFTNEGVKWCNIRELALDHVDLSDEMFQNIILSCRLIERLKISSCRGLEKIKVTNLEKLKNLSICYDRTQSVEVEAANMEFFKCCNDLCEMDGDRTPCIFKAFVYMNMKVLELFDIGITDEFFVDFGKKFPNLEKLAIDSCDDLHKVRISSHSLRILKFYGNGLKELQIDCPKIVRFAYGDSIIPCVFFTRVSTYWESDIVISILPMEIPSNSWFSKLKKMLTNLIGSKVFLEIKSHGSSTFGANEIEDITMEAGIQIEKLSLHISGSDAAAFPAFLDGCFWICRPKIIKQLWTGEVNIKFANFLHKMLIQRRNQDRLNMQETEFWQKDLKEVKVVIFKRTETEWQPEVLDWVELLKSDSKRFRDLRVVHFNLKW